MIDEFQFLFGERTRSPTRRCSCSRTSPAAAAVAGHPPRAGQPGRLRDRGVLGAPGDLRAVRAADRPAAGPPGARREQRRHDAPARAGTPWSTTSRGCRTATRSLRIPDATKDAVDEVLEHAARAGSRRRPDKPRLFDGSRAPPARRPDREACGHRRRPARALVGQCIDVARQRRHRRRCPPCPGRNIGVIGADGTDAVRVLAAAACRWARSTTPAEGRLRARPARRRGRTPAAATSCAGGSSGHDVDDRPARRVPRSCVAAARPRRSSSGCRSGDRPPTYLVLYARRRRRHRAGGAAATEALRKVLRFGPEIGVHTIGWWRSPQRLRSLLLDVRVAGRPRLRSSRLDVQGAELGTLAPRGCCPSGPRGPAGRCSSTGPGTRGRRSSSSRRRRRSDGRVRGAGMSGTDGARRGARVQGRHRRADRRRRRPARARPRAGRRPCEHRLVELGRRHGCRRRAPRRTGPVRRSRCSGSSVLDALWEEDVADAAEPHPQPDPDAGPGAARRAGRVEA